MSAPVLRLKVRTDNAAFGDGPDRELELGRILRAVADQIEQGDEHRVIFDLNGNAVGDWTLR